MSRCITTIATRETEGGRYVADVIELVHGNEYIYTTPDYDTAHSAYRNALRRLYQRHWKITETGKTEYLEG